MITEITTTKGFKVLQLDRLTDAINLFEGGLSICDSCNASSGGGYYIAVLNRFYCEECYNDWHERAIYYPEDKRVEEANYAYYLKRAKTLELTKAKFDIP